MYRMMAFSCSFANCAASSQVTVSIGLEHLGKMVSSIVNLIIATLITAPLGLAFPSVVTDQVLHRRGEIFYQAQGDSYAAGLGAGLYMSRASRCQQYTESYPNLLNAIINDGESISLENHQGCAGATAEEIIKNQPIDPAANLVSNHTHYDGVSMRFC